MIDCGIDESGSTKHLLVVSALIGQTSLMKKMSRAWTVDLKRHNVDFFHSKEHWNRKAKPYHGISMIKRRTLLTCLVGHIHRYAEAGFFVCIDTKEFDQIVTNRFKTQWGSSYSFAIQLLFIIIHLNLRQRGHLHETVNILIEDGHKNANQAMEIIANGKKNKGRLHYHRNSWPWRETRKSATSGS